MRISIFGLGYVGTVSAGCLADDGHTVIGVDPNYTKSDLINKGVSPIVEEGLEELIKRARENQLLSATNDAESAIQQTELSLVCVGTPSQANGNLDLKYVISVCEELGAALRQKSAYHVLVFRSTMLPTSMQDIVIPLLEQTSQKTAGIDFGICNNPEFLREGTAVYDYQNPPKTVIGEFDARSGDSLAKLYENLDAELIRTDIRTAEMVKYVDNIWHALKVGFANEIGNVCKALGLDSHVVMDIFCRDRKLNISSYYMRPGFAFGGSCLPKDLRAFTYKARSLDLSLPILDSILTSNHRQIERALQIVLEKRKKKIGVLGFTFKAGTDDLRESPVVELIERLIGKGCDVRIFDRNVNASRLMGTNRDYILQHVPHFENLMVDDVEEVLSHAELLVIGNADKEFAGVTDRLRAGQVLVDLVRIATAADGLPDYEGICW
jgi:GDP-mannose 6-dehydrogenase